MIDLGLLREQKQFIIERIKIKDPSFPIEKLAELDESVRKFQQEVDAARARKNELARLAKSGITEEIRQESRSLGAQLKEQEEQLIALEHEFRDLYLRCPNIPLTDVPVGNKEENQVVKVWGEKPVFDFEPKNHVELGELNKWFDFDAAVRMTASNFVFYLEPAVDVMYKLMFFMLKHNKSHGFTNVLPPYLVNEKALEGASNFPRFKDQVYDVKDDNLYLTPTSEVNLANLYRDQILEREKLPIRMTSWTSCFRREAGGYGAQERGLIRIHQFEKVELYTLCEPEHSDAEQQRMLLCAEQILQKLNLHYRVSLLAGQDCSFASAKTYDIEVWLPGQNEYKEVSSVSNCTDFQSRRCAIRYRQKTGEKTKLVHTLNGSSLALPRLMVALMETYQTRDGQINIPDSI